MPTFETRDKTTIYYNDWGTGSPVVLIHGWPVSHAMWEHQSTFLAQKDHRVIAYDRRGFGRSGQPWFGYDYDTLADDLHALLEHLTLRDVTLVGFSMGGGEVVRYLARHGSSRVRKAVLVGSVVPLLKKTPDHPEGVDPQVFLDMVAKVSEDRPHFYASFFKQFYGVGLLSKPVSQEAIDWTISLAMQGSPRATTECIFSFSATDFRPDLAALKVPTLLVHGDADATVPLDITSKAVAAKVPNAQLKVYEGAPHGLYLTHKDRLNRDLLEFLGQ